jgi:hypothetical protein
MGFKAEPDKARIIEIRRFEHADEYTNNNSFPV